MVAKSAKKEGGRGGEGARLCVGDGRGGELEEMRISDVGSDFR